MYSNKLLCYVVLCNVMLSELVVLCTVLEKAFQSWK